MLQVSPEGIPDTATYDDIVNIDTLVPRFFICVVSVKCVTMNINIYKRISTYSSTQLRVSRISTLS